MKAFKRYMNEEVLKKNSKYFYLKLLKAFLFGGRSKKIVILYRIGNLLFDSGYLKMASCFFLRLENKYGIFIGKKALIDIGVKFPHPTGIVIGDGCVIGKNVTIFQQVTIGGKIIGDAQNRNYPKVGDGCVLFTGAKLLGEIKIGDFCIIGANAVVLNDVPSKHTAVGVPAKSFMKSCDKIIC